MCKRCPLIRFISAGFAFVLLLAGLAVSVSAQSNKGTIKGTITDQNGAIVQNAAVTATKVDTNTARTVKAGDDGIYEIPLLEPGIYIVRVSDTSLPETVSENFKVTTASPSAAEVVL